MGIFKVFVKMCQKLHPLEIWSAEYILYDIGSFKINCRDLSLLLVMPGTAMHLATIQASVHIL